MSHTFEDVHGTPVLFCSADGDPVRDERAATDLIGDAISHGAAWVSVPVERLEDDFFRLRSGVAGGIVQKFANYRIGLAVVGDIGRHLSTGAALTDFVRECNRGRQLWFVQDVVELRERLESLAAVWPTEPAGR